jgi:hypothetical protein
MNCIFYNLESLIIHLMLFIGLHQHFFIGWGQHHRSAYNHLYAVDNGLSWLLNNLPHWSTLKGPNVCH